jgi:Rrf2 family protein
MKLTRAASYALQAVAFMANHKKGRNSSDPITSLVIASKREIPDRFLLKVLKPLVSAQILISIKGPHGGYRLAKSPHEITVLDIIEAVDGPIRGVAPLNPKDPDQTLHRRLDTICGQCAEQTRKHLGRIKISDIAGKE